MFEWWPLDGAGEAGKIAAESIKQARVPVMTPKPEPEPQPQKRTR